MSTQQIPLELGHRPTLGRADLLVTDGNQDAVSWIDRWPDWPSYALGVFGSGGCGKTHLLHVFAAVSDALVLNETDLSGLDPVAATRAHRAIAFDLAHGPLDEEALLHLLNAVMEASAHILLVSRESPARWSVQLPDLQSRLKAIYSVSIQAPDDATLKAVLAKLFQDRQVAIANDVIDYVVSRIPRTFAASHRLVEVADREALAQNRRITVPLIRSLLERPDIFSEKDQERSTS